MVHQYTSVEIENVKNWIIASLKRLILRDGDLLKHESISTTFNLQGEDDLNREIHETSINHHLACHLGYLIEEYGIYGYNVDIEYNRYFNNRKKVYSTEKNSPIEVRPDIIVHKRIRSGKLGSHFLVVEAKKHELIDKDCNHVKDIMLDTNYQYKYGMLVSYLEDTQKIQVNLLTLPSSEFLEYEFTVDK